MLRIQWTFNLDRAMKMSGKYGTHAHQHDAGMALGLLTRFIPFTEPEVSLIRSRREVRIECSTESFARYLIGRCDAGYLNCFRELDAKEVLYSPRVAAVPLINVRDES